MADTIPDIDISNEFYADINTLSGVAPGTEIIISNKSTHNIRLQIAAAQPASDSTDGEIIYAGSASTSVKRITAGESTVWALAVGHQSGKLTVQAA